MPALSCNGCSDFATSPSWPRPWCPPTRRNGTRNAGWTKKAMPGRRSILGSLRARRHSCRSASNGPSQKGIGEIMAVKLAKVGGEKKKVVEPTDTGHDNPTTQVKMSAKPTTRYDPLATVSIMDQMKTSSTTTAKTKRLPVIGHLPMAKQIQTLGLLLIAF